MNGATAERSALVDALFPAGIPNLWCPLLTHYRADGTIDTERISAHIRHMRPLIPAFLAPGSTGDGWEMTQDEADILLEFLLREAVRQDFSVMVGVLRTEPGTVVPAIDTFLRTHTAGTAPADATALAGQRVCGFTVTPPRGAALPQLTIHTELEAIAATGAPLAIYQLPQITENEMSPDTVADLATRFPNVYLMKDTSGRDVVAQSGVDLDNLFLVRGAEGDYARWSRYSGGPYDGFLLSTTNCFAAELGKMLGLLQEGRRDEAEAISERVTAVSGELLGAAGELPFGNPFANGNKAIDHHYAWGPAADTAEPPMTHSGERLPRSLVDKARDALRRNGLDVGGGYMNR